MKLRPIANSAFYLYISALICFTACGDKDSGDPLLAGSGAEEKTYAEQFTEKLENGGFSIGFTISKNGSDASFEVSVNRDMYFAAMESDGIYSEFYSDDGLENVYMAFPEIKCYSPAENGSYIPGIFELNKGNALSSVQTEDGKVTEVYVLSDVSGQKSVCTFVFDEETGDPIEFRNDLDGDENDSYIVFSSVDWKCPDIVFPDFSEWTDISDTANLTSAEEIKISLYFYGITEEELKEKGYTYEDLAELGSDELSAVYDDLGVTAE